jgi:hypothetical protein
VTRPSGNGPTARAILDAQTFAALRRPDGEPYEPAELPCAAEPETWSEDAPSTELIYAARTCVEQCPALYPCRMRALELGPLARGVWAGMLLEPDGTDTGPAWPY